MEEHLGRGTAGAKALRQTRARRVEGSEEASVLQQSEQSGEWQARGR